MKRIVLAFLFLGLSGCAHDLTLMSRTSAAAGQGVANEIGKTVQISLNGETYTGHYTFAQGGSYNLGTTTAFSGAHSTTAIGNGISIGATGNGNILARSADGRGLRCVFNYSGMGHSGSGVCLDDSGAAYDLQIN